jgi:CTP:molybdopterin cytidylyltransferase MocA
MTQRAKVGAVVLAAGDSSRLGRPKQLVRYQGIPLVARAARAALNAGGYPVIVVLGANVELVGAALSGLSVVPVVNPEWNRGMGTSVATGVRAMVDRAPFADGVLITLADQPLVGQAVLGQLLDAWADWRSGDSSCHTTIAAAEYAGTLGVPAVFGRAHFEALCSLSPAAGAAHLLRRSDPSVCRVAMPEAAVDIDTPNDLKRLRDAAKIHAAMTTERMHGGVI